MPRCKPRRCWAVRHYRYDIRAGGCYVGNDPINMIDPSGMSGACANSTADICTEYSYLSGGHVNKGANEKNFAKGAAPNLKPIGVAIAVAVKKLSVSKSKHPESAKHIQDAQKSGQPKTLTVDRAGTKDRRKEAMEGKEKESGKDRDEYPPAMFKEGGKNASVKNIDPSDNRGSGACIGNQCRGLPDGTQIEIEVVD